MVRIYILFYLTSKYDWKKIRMKRQENVWFYEKLNIMCSDTSKNIFDKFMIARNVESKKMNKMKNRTRTENTKNV